MQKKRKTISKCKPPKKIKEEKNNYISLAEASNYSRYSQEYLSLRARQGKFKAVKNGRNWVTTKKWIQEYEQQMKPSLDKFSKIEILKNLNLLPLYKSFLSFGISLCIVLLAVLAYPKIFAPRQQKVSGVNSYMDYEKAKETDTEKSEQGFIKILKATCVGLTNEMTRSAENFGESLGKSEKTLAVNMYNILAFSADVLKDFNGGAYKITKNIVNACDNNIKSIPKTQNEFNELVEWKNEWKKINASENIDEVENTQSLKHNLLGLGGLLKGSKIVLDYNNYLMGKTISGFEKGMGKIVGGLDKTMSFVFRNQDNKLDLKFQEVTAKEMNSEIKTEYVAVSLVPEYPNSVLNADGTNNKGVLISGYDELNNHNYYRWKASGNNQDYDILVRWLVPEDFVGFDNAYGFNVFNKINNASGNNAIIWNMLDTSNTLVIFNENTRMKNSVWTENRFTYNDSPQFIASNNSKRYWITFQIKLIADSGGLADVGEITFKYKKRKK